MQKRKSTFNIIDALIVLLVVAVGLGVYFLFFRQSSDVVEEDQPAPQNARIRYVLQVSEIKNEYTDNIQIGEKVIEYGTRTSVGEVTAVGNEEYVYVGHDKTTGQQKLTPLKDYSNLYITVEGNATMKSELYYINENAMYVGRKIDMFLPDLFCTGTCISLEIIE